MKNRKAQAISEKMAPLDRRSRGQAALEFLSSYGWAILVIAIVLVALAWLGIFNVANKTPDRCTMQGGLECNSAVLRTGLQLTEFKVTNRLTQPIYVCGLKCTNNPDKAVVPISSCAGTGAKIASGEKVDVIGQLPSALTCTDYFAGSTSSGRYSVGDTYSGRIEMYYSNDFDANGGNARISYGDIALKVQPG
ncbi:MAG: hypothetical protein WC759_03555 [Candidatus Micrarchaeia archaeon]|jgi:hypothetical protein